MRYTHSTLCVLALGLCAQSSSSTADHRSSLDSHSETSSDHNGTTHTSDHGNGNDHEHGGEAHQHHIYEALVLPILFLIIGMATSHFLSRHAPSIPYTLALFLLGLALGVWHHQTAKALGMGLSRSIELWTSIDPHLLLYAFLPALLFADAVHINVHLFYKCFWSCLLLASLGVLFGAFMTALVAFHWLPFGFTWNESMTFGSILAATDPVAVVSILSSIGASAKLNMYVAGESLLNDGVAIVIFNLFSNMSRGKTYTFAEGLAYFCALFFGGIFVGLVLGLLCSAWLSLVGNRLKHDDRLIQTGVLLATAYSSFYVSEAICAFSGVLGVVTAGLVVSATAWPIITSREALDTIFHFLEFLGNTILFQLAGAIVGSSTGQLVAEKSFAKYGMATFVGAELVVYGSSQIIRMGMIMLFLPVLSRLGYGMSWRDGLAMAWGGLRGAVGLALAISVKNESTDIHGSPLDPEALERRLSLFYTVAIFTTWMLLVNAPTTGPLLRKLRLVGEDAASKEKMAMDLRQLESETDKWAAKYLSQRLEFKHVQVDQLVTQQRISRAQEQSPLAGDFSNTVRTGERAHAKLGLVREVYLRILREHYWCQVDEGMLPHDSFVTLELLHSIDVAMDHTAVTLVDGKVIKDSLLPAYQAHSRLLLLLTKVLPNKWLLRVKNRLLLEKNFIYMCLAFIAAHQHAQKQICGYFENSIRFPEDMVRTVVAEGEHEVESMKVFLDDQDREENGLVEFVRKQRATLAVINFKINRVEKMIARGLLSNIHGHELLHDLEHKLAVVKHEDHDWATIIHEKQSRWKVLAQLHSSTHIIAAHHAISTEMTEEVAASEDASTGQVSAKEHISYC